MLRWSAGLLFSGWEECLELVSNLLLGGLIDLSFTLSALANSTTILPVFSPPSIVRKADPIFGKLNFVTGRGRSLPSSNRSKTTRNIRWNISDFSARIEPRSTAAKEQVLSNPCIANFEFSVNPACRSWQSDRTQPEIASLRERVPLIAS